MSLRIGFDLDGVLADMESALLRQAELLFGDALARRLQERAADTEETAPATASAPGEDPKEDVAARRRRTAAPSLDMTPPWVKLMTARQQRQLWRHVKRIENFWETLAEVEPGIVARLARLAAERRWEIVFLTQRPETIGSTAQLQTQRWLEGKGFRLPRVIVAQGSRGAHATALGLDLVVDDRPENCVDVVADSNAQAVLVWRDDETLVPAAQRLGIAVVKTTAQCLDMLAALDTRPSTLPTGAPPFLSPPRSP